LSYARTGAVYRRAGLTALWVTSSFPISLAHRFAVDEPDRAPETILADVGYDADAIHAG